MLGSYSNIQKNRDGSKHCVSDVMMEKRRVSLLLAFSPVIVGKIWKPGVKKGTLDSFNSRMVL
jgi:hypothetical protein